MHTESGAWARVPAHLEYSTFLKRAVFWISIFIGSYILEKRNKGLLVFKKAALLLK